LDQENLDRFAWNKKAHCFLWTSLEQIRNEVTYDSAKTKNQSVDILTKAKT